MLEPLQKIVRLSPPIAASLAVPDIFTRTRQKLGHKDAVTRLNLLRILRTICDATEEQCTLIKHFGVYDTILHLSNHDPAILVRQMAEELVRACDSGSKSSSISRASGFRRPASSAGARAGSGSSTGSSIMSGMTPSTPTSLKNKFAIPTMSPILSPASTPSSSREPRDRERIGRSQSTAGLWDLQSQTSPRPAPLMRASTALAAISASPSAPSPRSGVSRPPSRDNSSLARLEANRELSAGLGAGSGKSRLPKARQGRVSEVGVKRRGERESVFGAHLTVGEENQTPASPGSAGSNSPLPRLQIARRRRDTSGSDVSALGMGRRGSRVSERDA